MVRRHVLGMSDDASVWARFGQRLGRAALWAARLLVDFRATRAGIRHAILRATPLPELEERAAGREDLDVTAILREELAVGLERIRRAAEADLGKLGDRVEVLSEGTSAAIGALDALERIRRVAEADLAKLAGRVEDLAAVVTQVGQLGREGQHRLAERLSRLELEAAAAATARRCTRARRRTCWRCTASTASYGRREVASRVAGELAEAAGLQPGTARAYVYEELARLAGEPTRPARTARPR